MVKLLWIIMPVFLSLFILFAAPVFSQNALSENNQQEEFLYNPLPNIMLEKLKKMTEDISFVLDNYFIYDGINNEKHIKSRHKIALSGERIKPAISSLQKQLSMRFDDIVQTTSEKRSDLADKVNKLENCRIATENLLAEIFQSVLTFDFSDYNNNARDKNKDDYANYMFSLKNRMEEFQYNLIEIYDITDEFREGETTLAAFERMGFVIKGNCDKKMNSAPIIKYADAAKKLNFIKKDGTPFTDKEMKGITSSNFSIEQENPLAVKWFPISWNGLHFFGIIFRDIPNFKSPDKFEEVMEIYFLGQISDDTIGNIMFKKISNSRPIEIRWIDESGKKYIIWDKDLIIYPTNFTPPARNSLYNITL